MRIQLKDITQDFFSGESGLMVGKYLDKIIRNNIHQPIEISLREVLFVTPSFINGAFIYLLELYGEDYFRKFIRLVEANKAAGDQVSSSIRRFIEDKGHFFANFKMNTIYLTSDGSEESNMELRKLQNANHSNIRFLFQPSSYIFQKDLSLISQSDCIIGLFNHQPYTEEFLEEVNYGIMFKKPVLLLLQKDIKLNIPADIKRKVHVIRHNTDQVALAIRNVNEFIQNQTNKKTSLQGNNMTSADLVAWTLLGLGAAYVIKEVLSDD